MYLLPKVILRGGYVYSPDLEIDETTQLQPNGIDVRIKNLFQISSGTYPIFEKGKVLHAPSYEQEVDDNNFFRLCSNIPYTAECYEKVKIPKNTVAMVIGRSSLNRNGILVRSSLYDSGFNNYIGLTLFPMVSCKIEKGSRIAQIVFQSAESSFTYNGQYQGE